MNNEKLLIKKQNIVFCFILGIFIFSECCSWFSILDSLHIKHYILMGVVLLNFIKYHSKFFNLKNWSEEFKNTMIIILVFLIVSWIFQIKNGSFKAYTIKELYYILLPVMFIEFKFYKKSNDLNMDRVMDFVLYSVLFCFVITGIDNGTLTFSNFISTLNLNNLFVESESAIGEVGLVSSCCTLLEIYYISRKNKKKAILSFIGVFLGYKRFCVFYAFIVLIVGWIFRDRKVNKKIILLTTIIFVILPFVTKLMCTNEFANWFYHKFGIEFNKFTMTRFSIINAVIDADFKNYGLGTVTNFLEQRGHQGQLNMHNDILMIYLDCTILGSIVFTYFNFKLSEQSIYSYFVMLFIFFQMFVTHCLGSGTVIIWIMTYLLIYYFNRNVEVNKG